MTTLPTEPFVEIYLFGISDAVTCLFAIIAFAYTLRAARSDCIRLPLIALGVSILTLTTGAASCIFKLIGVFDDLATTSTASIQDLCGGLYVSISPLFLGLLLGAPLISANIILFAKHFYAPQKDTD